MANKKGGPTKWQKGCKSPNPLGQAAAKLKDPEYRSVMQLARTHTMDAIKALVECLSDERGSTRVAAAEAILDRGWGRPHQAVKVVDDEGNASQVTEMVVRFALPGEVVQNAKD